MQQIAGVASVVTLLGMKRVLLGTTAVYLLAAVVTRGAEAARIGPNRCGCEPACWCKKPGLTLFRWVIPKRKHHLLTPADKRLLAEASTSN